MRKLACLVTVLLLQSLPVPAQHYAVNAMDPEFHSSLRFELPEGAEEVSFPFRNANNHLLLAVTVNGAGPFQVILDTGMPTEDLLLYDSDRVKALKLSFLDDTQVKVSGAGGKGKGRSARMAQGLTLGVGDLRILDARAIVPSIAPGFGAYHDGVIGAALFRNFVVSIDNDRGVLTLRRPESYQPPEGSRVVPLAFEHGFPFVDAKVRIGEGEPVAVNLAVDLGASHAVSINESEEKGIRAPARSIATTIGRGVSGDITGKVGRIGSLEIGGVAFSNVVATFPDAEFHSPHGMDSRDGNLGDGLLSRCLVTFDYAGKRMVLQPAQRFSDPFEWDMSGMQAEPTGKGTVQVRRVIPGSPAAEAGVKEGDQITKFDGEAVAEATYFEIREKLKKDGETVVLELRRGKQSVIASLKLRRLV